MQNVHLNTELVDMEIDTIRLDLIDKFGDYLKLQQAERHKYHFLQLMLTGFYDYFACKMTFGVKAIERKIVDDNMVADSVHGQMMHAAISLVLMYDADYDWEKIKQITAYLEKEFIQLKDMLDNRKPY